MRKKTIQLGRAATALLLNLSPDDSGLSPVSTLQGGDAPMPPAIDFMLEHAGWISISEKYSVPAAMAQMPAQGAAASLPHPSSTQQEANSMRAASELVMKAFASAVASQAEGKGCFHQPFFARCAWRLADGRHLAASSPVLMLPMTLPPCIGVDSASEANGASAITFSASSHPYFRLKRRIRAAAPDSLRGLVAGVDIFVSAPIATYDAKKASVAGLARYSAIAAKAGGYASGRDFDPAQVLAGQWAGSDGVCKDHTLADLGLAAKWAWTVEPNPSLASDLLRPQEFYRIESIDIADFAPSSSFAPTDVKSAAAEGIKRGQRLEEEAERRPRSSRLITMDASGALHLEGHSLSLPAPDAIVGSAAYAGATSHAPEHTTATVWTRRGGQTLSVSTSGLSHPLAGQLPRYAWHPDPGAFQMLLAQGGNSWLLPLQPADDGKGAYWFAGLGASVSAPATYSSIAPNPAPSPEASCQAALATIPLEIDAGVTEVVVNGDFECGHVAITLEASECGQRWCPLAWSRSHRISGLAGSRHRYYRILAACSLAPGERLATATLWLI